MIDMQSKQAEDAREGVSTRDDERETDNRIAIEGEPIARAFDPADGEHVANLYTVGLTHEFREHPLWEVEIVQEEAVDLPDEVFELEEATEKEVEQAVESAESVEEEDEK